MNYCSLKHSLFSLFLVAANCLFAQEIPLPEFLAVLPPNPNTSDEVNVVVSFPEWPGTYEVNVSDTSINIISIWCEDEPLRKSDTILVEATAALPASLF